MWIGEGDFDSYGYFKSAYIKGQMEHLRPEQCYQIVDKGPPDGNEQYQFIPVDEGGHELGPPAIKTAGQVVYSIWERGRSSTDYDISNKFIE